MEEANTSCRPAWTRVDLLAANTRLRGGGEHLEQSVGAVEAVLPQIRASVEEANTAIILCVAGLCMAWPQIRASVEEANTPSSDSCSSRRSSVPQIRASVEEANTCRTPSSALLSMSRKYAPPWRRRTRRRRRLPSRGGRSRKYAPPWRRRTQVRDSTYPDLQEHGALREARQDASHFNHCVVVKNRFPGPDLRASGHAGPRQRRGARVHTMTGPVVGRRRDLPIISIGVAPGTPRSSTTTESW